MGVGRYLLAWAARGIVQTIVGDTAQHRSAEVGVDGPPAASQLCLGVAAAGSQGFAGAVERDLAGPVAEYRRTLDTGRGQRAPGGDELQPWSVEHRARECQLLRWMRLRQIRRRTRGLHELKARPRRVVYR